MMNMQQYTAGNQFQQSPFNNLPAQGQMYGNQYHANTTAGIQQFSHQQLIEASGYNGQPRPSNSPNMMAKMANNNRNKY